MENSEMQHSRVANDYRETNMNQSSIEAMVLLSEPFVALEGQVNISGKTFRAIVKELKQARDIIDAAALNRIGNFCEYTEHTNNMLARNYKY